MELGHYEVDDDDSNRGMFKGDAARRHQLNREEEAARILDEYIKGGGARGRFLHFGGGRYSTHPDSAGLDDRAAKEIANEADHKSYGGGLGAIMGRVFQATHKRTDK